MICDDCIHNAVCERAHFDNHCGYKHTEADIISSELEKIKAEINSVYFHRDIIFGVIDERIKELKGETMSKNDEFIEMLESIKTEIKNESGIGFDGEHYIDIPEVNTIIDRYIGELKGENNGNS